MKRVSVLSAFAAAIALFNPATSAHADTLVTHVSAFGSSAPNCDTPAGACFNIGGAINVTAEGGILRCVGAHLPGSNLTITRSITIDCALGGGGMNAQGLTINAPGKTVVLRNVDFNCLGFCALPGVINILAADRVVLKNVHVQGGTIGIYDHRTGPGYLMISESKIEGNGGPGIVIAPSGGNLGVVLDNVQASNNTYGLGVGAGGRVMIKRSVFSANSVAGIQADTGAIVAVNETLISHNSTGVNALNGSTVTLSNSDVDSNNTAANGAWFTFGNNRFVANLGNGTAPSAVGTATSDLGQR